jgi:hypothetical protein
MADQSTSSHQNDDPIFRTEYDIVISRS